MVSLVQIQYILTLFEERHFQRAAEKCFVTQPTLSVQVQKAEQILGGRLFDRDRTPLEPTALMRRLLPVFLQLQQDMSQLEQLVKSDKKIAKEELKIGIIPTIAHYLIPDLFGLMQEESHNYQLVYEEHRTQELIEMLALRKIDLAILSGPVEIPEFRVQKLFSEEIAFYMKHPRPLNKVSDLQEELPWLLIKGNCLRAQMENLCAVDSSWNYQGSSIDVLTRMVDRYGGYTVIPMNYPKDHLDPNKIVRMNQPVPARSVVAAFHPRSYHLEHINELMKTIQMHYVSNHTDDWVHLNWQ
jgi:LysR family hydrogen peroxide-inducible transcriptional activator